MSSFQESRFTPANKNELLNAIHILKKSPESANATYGCISTWDTRLITDMSYLFFHTNYTSFEDGDIGDWDVSNVTNMNGMFHGSENFNQDIGKWDVSKVKNMRSMFQHATKFNQDIGKWDVSKVESMEYMFWNTNFNQEIGI